MCCTVSRRCRYLAVNRCVRRPTADSGAVRSHRVPNLKVRRFAVAFRYSVTSSSGAACANPPPLLRPCRRIRGCAICRRGSGKGTAIDTFHYDPRTAPGPACPPAACRSHQIQPVVVRALPFDIPLMRGAPAPQFSKIPNPIPSRPSRITAPE